MSEKKKPSAAGRSAMRTAEFFAERGVGSDVDLARLLQWPEGQPPADTDRLP